MSLAVLSERALGSESDMELSTSYRSAGVL